MTTEEFNEAEINKEKADLLPSLLGHVSESEPTQSWKASSPHGNHSPERHHAEHDDAHNAGAGDLIEAVSPGGDMEPAADMVADRDVAVEERVDAIIGTQEFGLAGLAGVDATEDSDGFELVKDTD